MKYPYRVYRTQVEDHVFWTAESPALKGCVGQGETLEEAVTELESNEQAWLELAEEYEMEIPEVPIEDFPVYSGKLTLRVAPYVHQQAAEMAKRQGVSLNQYLNDAIVAQNARLAAVGSIGAEAKKGTRRSGKLPAEPTRTPSRVRGGKRETTDLRLGAE
ncbi:MAG: type II toxin-antitoxin system HicB family antitoxin [Clostridia bacterium]|nr:type II toxin-antitoxin system HicB family antitoxin [Clostridia bacterium]